MRLICTSDQHYPVHDPVVENAILKFAQHVKPTHWVVAGDLYDFFSVSKYDKEPDRKESLQDEFDSARPYLTEIDRLTEKEIHYIPGNHEQRLDRLICEVPGLYGLRALAIPRMAEMPARIKCHPYGSIVTVGRVNYMHGDQVKSSGNPAGWVLTNMPGTSCVFGHFHRSHTIYRTSRDPDNGGQRSFVAASQGHGCDVSKARYDKMCPTPQWQHGFTYVEYYTVGKRPRFSLHPIVIVNGRFMWGGRLFDGNRP